MFFTTSDGFHEIKYAPDKSTPADPAFEISIRFDSLGGTSSRAKSARSIALAMRNPRIRICGLRCVKMHFSLLPAAAPPPLAGLSAIPRTGRRYSQGDYIRQASLRVAFEMRPRRFASGIGIRLGIRFDLSLSFSLSLSLSLSLSRLSFPARDPGDFEIDRHGRDLAGPGSPRFDARQRIESSEEDLVRIKADKFH